MEPTPRSNTWKRIGVKSPSAGGGACDTSRDSSSKYKRVRPLDQKVLVQRDLSASRYSQDGSRNSLGQNQPKRSFNPRSEASLTGQSDKSISQKLFALAQGSTPRIPPPKLPSPSAFKAASPKGGQSLSNRGFPAVRTARSSMQQCVSVTSQIPSPETRVTQPLQTTQSTQLNRDYMILSPTHSPNMRLMPQYASLRESIAQTDLQMQKSVRPSQIAQTPRQSQSPRKEPTMSNSKNNGEYMLNADIAKKYIESTLLQAELTVERNKVKKLEEQLRKTQITNQHIKHLFHSLVRQYKSMKTLIASRLQQEKSILWDYTNRLGFEFEVMQEELVQAKKKFEKVEQELADMQSKLKEWSESPATPQLGSPLPGSSTWPHGGFAPQNVYQLMNEGVPTLPQLSELESPNTKFSHNDAPHSPDPALLDDFYDEHVNTVITTIERVRMDINDILSLNKDLSDKLEMSQNGRVKVGGSSRVGGLRQNGGVIASDLKTSIKLR